MTFSIRPLNAEDATTMTRWRYEAPYDFYNLPDDKEEQIAEFLRPEYHYHAIEDRYYQFIGYFCFGPDARVPDCEYEENSLDLGLGLDPALAGQGLGGACLRAVLQWIRTHQLTSSVRANVAAWNGPRGSTLPASRFSGNRDLLCPFRNMLQDTSFRS